MRYPTPMPVTTRGKQMRKVRRDSDVHSARCFLHSSVFSSVSVIRMNSGLDSGRVYRSVEKSHAAMTTPFRSSGARVLCNACPDFAVVGCDVMDARIDVGSHEEESVFGYRYRPVIANDGRCAFGHC